MNHDHFWLTEAQFARLEPFLPTDTRGKLRVDGRTASRPFSTVTATPSSACSDASRTSAVSPQGMTAWPLITLPPSVSRLPCATGYESGP